MMIIFRAISALVDLDLSNNAITSDGMPPLGDLHNAQVIQLTHNKLQYLPSLNGCNNLKEIHLGYNKMKVLNYHTGRGWSILLTIGVFG